jgi:hypothetical protein
VSDLIFFQIWKKSIIIKILKEGMEVRAIVARTNVGVT